MGTCVSCGNYCREGEMICLQCQLSIKEHNNRGKRKEEEKNDFNNLYLRIYSTVRGCFGKDT